MLRQHFILNRWYSAVQIEKEVYMKTLYAIVIVLFVFLRSPKGLKKKRAHAWWLARTLRLYTHLEQQELDTLEHMVAEGILEHIEGTRTALMTAEKGFMEWVEEVRLVPLKKLSAP